MGVDPSFQRPARGFPSGHSRNPAEECADLRRTVNPHRIWGFCWHREPEHYLLCFRQAFNAQPTLGAKP